MRKVISFLTALFASCVLYGYQSSDTMAQIKADGLHLVATNIVLAANGAASFFINANYTGIVVDASLNANGAAPTYVWTLWQKAVVTNTTLVWTNGAANVFRLWPLGVNTVATTNLVKVWMTNNEGAFPHLTNNGSLIATTPVILYGNSQTFEPQMLVAGRNYILQLSNIGLATTNTIKLYFTR